MAVPLWPSRQRLTHREVTVLGSLSIVGISEWPQSPLVCLLCLKQSSGSVLFLGGNSLEDKQMYSECSEPTFPTDFKECGKR